jgi:hypothetical protein
MNLIDAVVTSIVGAFVGALATMVFRWWSEGKPGKSLLKVFRNIFQGHPLVREARKLGIASISRDQEARQKNFEPQTQEARPSGIRDMLDEAETEIWLFHLSGGDQVFRNRESIVGWLFPKNPPNKARRLRLMALDPLEPVVEAVARLNGRDPIDYSKEIENVFSDLNKRLEASKKDAEDKFPSKYNSSWEFKVYRSAPACSIVATDPNDEKAHLFLEFYGYHFGWPDRVCLELTKASNGSLCRSYIDSFENLWVNKRDSRDYPHGSYL